MVIRPTNEECYDSCKLLTTDAFYWQLLIWVMGIATPLIVSLKPRRFIVGEIDVAEKVGDLSQFAGRGLSFFMLIFACIVGLRHFSRINSKIDQPYARSFWVFTILLVLMPTLSTLIAGDKLSSSGILVTIIIYSATYFLPTPPLSWWIIEVRIMLLIIFIYGSLVSSILLPTWALDFDYAAESTTAIFPLRLFGTAEHANTLAHLAIFTWMLGRFPNTRLRWEYLHNGATLLVLLLTQSKTNFAIVLILSGILLLSRIKKLETTKKYLTYLSIGVVCVFVFTYLVKYSHLASRIEDMLYDPQVFTLTGRLPLWVVAVEMWLERPWFGQGLDAWSSQAVLDYISLLGWGATHAHNQVLQILSQSGIIGLGVFTIWITYFKKAWHKAPINIRNPFFMLTVVFFLPGLTEVILQYGLGKASAVRSWILFVIVLFLLRKPTSIQVKS